jgi:hypothetical protein
MESVFFVITVLIFHRFHELSLFCLYSMMQGAINCSENFISTYCAEILEMRLSFCLEFCVVKYYFCYAENKVKEFLIL